MSITLRETYLANAVARAGALSLALCLLGTLASSQIPDQDARNVNTPGTDTKAAMPRYTSVAEWEARKAFLRRQILSAAGLLPFPERTPLHPQIFGRLDRGDYSIENVLLETLPGYYLGGNLYRPTVRTGKLPGVLNPHGHWVYGRLENEPDDSNPSFGISLARQGYVGFRLGHGGLQRHRSDSACIWQFHGATVVQGALLNLGPEILAARSLTF